MTHLLCLEETSLTSNVHYYIPLSPKQVALTSTTVIKNDAQQVMFSCSNLITKHQLKNWQRQQKFINNLAIL